MYCRYIVVAIKHEFSWKKPVILLVLLKKERKTFDNIKITFHTEINSSQVKTIWDFFKIRNIEVKSNVNSGLHEEGGISVN